MPVACEMDLRYLNVAVPFAYQICISLGLALTIIQNTAERRDFFVAVNYLKKRSWCMWRPNGENLYFYFLFHSFLSLFRISNSTYIFIWFAFTFFVFFTFKYLSLFVYCIYILLFYCHLMTLKSDLHTWKNDLQISQIFFGVLFFYFCNCSYDY